MPLSPQETLEDLDRNKDGYVQVEEYIGEWAKLSPRGCLSSPQPRVAADTYQPLEQRPSGVEAARIHSPKHSRSISCGSGLGGLYR